MPAREADSTRGLQRWQPPVVKYEGAHAAPWIRARHVTRAVMC